MKILFINPFRKIIPKMGRPTMITELVGNYQPIGLLYVAAYTLKYNPYAEIRLVDGLVDGKDKVIEALQDFKPDIVGITAYTMTLLDVLETIKLAKTYSPNCLICLGGHHVDCFPQLTLSYPGVDFVVRGEGEVTFSELIDAIKNKKPCRGIKGLGYRDENGAPVLNEPRGKIEDLNELPFPARQLTDPQKYYCIVGKKRFGTIILSSRGCPYRCIFCKEAGSKHRARNIDNVIDEIEQCVKTGVEDFFFYDDTFNISEKRVMEFCAGLRRRKIKCYWSFRGRVNGLSFEALKEAKQCGCFRIQFGVEAGTEAALKNLKKDIKIEDVKKVFKWCNELKIQTVGYFILGNPGETLDDIRQTINLALEIKPSFANFSILVCMPASEMNQIARDRNLPWANFWENYVKNPDPDIPPPVWGERFSRPELEELQRQAYKKFYQRPGYYWNTLKNINNASDLIRKIDGGVKMFYWNYIQRRNTDIKL